MLIRQYFQTFIWSFILYAFFYSLVYYYFHSKKAKINIPKPWADELGFDETNKTAIMEIDVDKIIIRKKENEMVMNKEVLKEILEEKS